MKQIAQFRCNLFLLEQDEYDCSIGGNYSVDWSTRGTVRPYFGVYCLLFSFVTVPLYLLSAQVIWRMKRIATYKIMLFLAISDILALFFSSFTFGIFLLKGEVFCHHPKVHLLNGVVSMFFFTFSSITCLILAINRMLELISGRIYVKIFIGYRTWYILAASIAYPIALAFFTPPFLFNSDFHLLTLDPGIYMDKYDYYNVAEIFNNTMMPLLACIVYIVMLLFLLFKHNTSLNANNSDAVNRAAMMLSIQSGIIVIVHSTTGITYMISQYIELSDTFLFIAQISWQCLHGTPPFVYMIFNRTLRDGVKDYVAPVRPSIISLTSTVSPKSVVPSRITTSAQ